MGFTEPVRAHQSATPTGRPFFSAGGQKLGRMSSLNLYSPQNNCSTRCFPYPPVSSCSTDYPARLDQVYIFICQVNPQIFVTFTLIFSIGARHHRRHIWERPWAGCGCQSFGRKLTWIRPVCRLWKHMVLLTRQPFHLTFSKQNSHSLSCPFLSWCVFFMFMSWATHLLHKLPGSQKLSANLKFPDSVEVCRALHGVVHTMLPLNWKVLAYLSWKLNICHVFPWVLHVPHIYVNVLSRSRPGAIV